MKRRYKLSAPEHHVFTVIAIIYTAFVLLMGDIFNADPETCGIFMLPVMLFIGVIVKSILDWLYIAKTAICVLAESVTKHLRKEG